MTRLPTKIRLPRWQLNLMKLVEMFAGARDLNLMLRGTQILILKSIARLGGGLIK